MIVELGVVACLLGCWGVCVWRWRRSLNSLYLVKERSHVECLGHSRTVVPKKFVNHLWKEGERERGGMEERGEEGWRERRGSRGRRKREERKRQ